MANSKNHHFLPQFYLRGFHSGGTSKKNLNVWSFCKTTSVDPSEKLIKDVACEEHFHTVTKSDGTIDSDSIEVQLGKLETIYSPVRRKLLDGGTLDANERHLLSKFVCLMKMRTPAEKAFIDQMLLGAAKATSRALVANNRLEKELSELPKVKHWPAPARAELARRMRKAHVEGKVGFANSNASLLNPMFTTAFNPELIAFYDKMELEILKVPMGSVFITGDQPVILFDPTPPHLSIPGTGLICRAVEVTFPLSTQMLLRFSWKHPSGERVVTAAEVNEFNRRTVIMARKSVFASRCDDTILKLIRENYAHSAGSDFIATPLPDGKAFILSRTIPVRPVEYY